jgi:hypothetical protein
VKRVLSHAYDLPALGARIDRAAAAILAHTPTDARTTADFTSLRENLLPLKQYLARRKVWAPRPAIPWICRRPPPHRNVSNRYAAASAR